MWRISGPQASLFAGTSLLLLRPSVSCCELREHARVIVEKPFGRDLASARKLKTAGCLRDVVQNHRFQIVALLAMEAPAGRDFGAVHNEKAKLFQAMRP